MDIAQTIQMPTLYYGLHSTVSLASAEGTVPEIRGLPAKKTLSDARAAVRASLREPLEYPPLARCVLPEDKVAIALDRGLPQAAQLSAGAIDALLEIGLQPGQIAVLWLSGEAGADPRPLLPADVAAEIHWIEHNPDDPASVAFLGVDAADEAIRVHRALHEADVVLPIGCLRPEDSDGYFGVHGVIYPTYSDTKTLERFRTPAILEDGGRRRQRLLADTEAAAWALGVCLTIQAVPAGDGAVAGVFAGEIEAVRKASRRLYQETWTGAACRRASLVVAGIEGDVRQQTWENLGRALAVSGELADDNGEVVICCEITAEPGESVQRMATARERDWAMRQIGKHPATDALCAARLDAAQRRGRVYVLGGLPATLCEQLDITQISEDELERLARRHASVTVLANAQWAVVAPAQ